MESSYGGPFIDGLISQRSCITKTLPTLQRWYVCQSENRAAIYRTQILQTISLPHYCTLYRQRFVVNVPWETTLHCSALLHWLAAFYTKWSLSHLIISSVPTEFTIVNYRQISIISRTLIGNKFGDHSYVVWASHIGSAPDTSSVSI